MSKKLLSLVLVLALAGMASAVQWIGPAYTDTTPGDWATATNWDVGYAPTATDALGRWDRSDGAGGNVIVTSAVSGGVKPQTKFGSAKLEITSTGSISNDGSVEQGKGTYSHVTIQTGGVWNACQKINTTTGTFKLSSASNAEDIVDVYGKLNVKGKLADSDLAVSQGASTGIGRVNIYAGGLVDVDYYSINGTVIASGTFINQTRGKITIAAGGLMKIKGWVDTQVNNDIANGLIVCNDPHIRAWLVTEGATQYTYVPEPATIALLGLGSLMLLRKKR